MPSYKNTSLHQKLSCKRSLRKLCAEAIKQQVASGQAEATHLRNRRRHLARQILKRLPHASRLSTKKLLHAATMLLAMWGFAGISMPDKAEAATLFKHVMLNGVHVGSSAAPTFADIDNDGDLDVFVGEVTGTVKFYRNDGTNAAPDWVADIAANPLAGFNVGLFASPSFADIDNDGDLDAFIGVGGNYNVASGTVKFYRNNGTAAAPNFVADTVGNPLAGFDVGTYAKPNFADIDNDGDLDAFVGVGGYKAVSGTVKFYQNTGTAASPTFVAVNGVGNPLNGFNVGRYAAPSFADIDNDGDLDVFIGSGGYKAVSGTVKFYRNSGTNTAPVFAADAAGNPLAGSMARNTVPSFADIDGDGDLDAFVGEAYGTVKSYRNTGTATAPVFTAIMGDGSVGNPLSGFDVGYNATPSFADIDNDGDLDAFVGEKGGSVKFYQNTGTAAAPTFTAIAGTGNPLNGVAVNSYATPTFADIDNDGDLDAFVGEDYGTVKFYQNTGTAAAPAFTAVVGAGNPLNGFAVRSYAKPSFADIDNDGDLDAFVGSKNRGVAFYRNTGTAAVPVFTADVAGNPLNGFFTIASGIRLVSPSFADIDNDGDLDAFVGERSGAVKFYRNTGSATAPVFTADTAGNPLNGFVVTRSAAPSFADIDNDGDLDVFVGEGFGTVKFFENFDIQPLGLLTGTGKLLISTPTTGASIPSTSMISATLVNPPAGNFPFGKISYNVITTAGGTVTVRMVLPSALTAGFIVYKIDAANNYTVIPASQYTQINSTTIDLTLTDGGAFDLDGNASNGVIVDPITISVPTAASSTVSGGGGGGGGCVIQPNAKFDPMLLLLALMASFAAWVRRKRS